MICRPCRDAADQQQPRDAHCQAAGGPDSPCCCQHRTERYRRDEEQPLVPSAPLPTTDLEA